MNFKKMLYYTLKRLGDTGKIVSCKSKGLFLEKLAPPTTTDNSLSPLISWYIKGSCLTQKNATKTIFTIFFIVYELDKWSRDVSSDFSLKGCLFGGVKLAKNTDRDKYIYWLC